MGLQTIRKVALGLLMTGVLVGCERSGLPGSGSQSGEPLPANDALAFEYERFFFGPGSTASGSVAHQLRRDTVAFPVEGALTRTRSNPIPAEIMMHVRSMNTGGGRVSMSGDLMIRDLRLGGVMTRLEDYSYSGLMPRVSGGAEIGPALFRLIEVDVQNWLTGLECSAQTRLCGEPGIEPVQDVAPLDEEFPEGTATMPADANVDLAKLSNQRRGRRGEVNSGGLSPAAILAAAPPTAPTPAPAPTPAAPTVGDAPAPAAVAAPTPSRPVALGSTVASLGLLDRSGNWLRTPLVSVETPGRIRNTSTGSELDVLLIPKDGAPGAGSQISLAALSELGASLTDLLTLIVYRLE